MEAIEKENAATLKGVLPKDYGRPTLDRQMIGDLVDLFSNIKQPSLYKVARAWKLKSFIRKGLAKSIRHKLLPV